MPILLKISVGLCPDCSKKLNYHTKKREVKRIKQKHKQKYEPCSKEGTSTSTHSGNRNQVEDTEPEETRIESPQQFQSPWEVQKPIETKSRDEEMEEYLEDLLL